MVDPTATCAAATDSRSAVGAPSASTMAVAGDSAGRRVRTMRAVCAVAAGGARAVVRGGGGRARGCVRSRGWVR